MQFLETFASKQISSSEDRLEDTKRKKLAKKAEKLVEIMMVSGIPTASGYEERIRFAEMEVVDRGAQEHGLVANTPEGHPINGWDVNVAGVRMHSVKKRFRTHQEGVRKALLTFTAVTNSRVGIHYSRQDSWRARTLCCSPL